MIDDKIAQSEEDQEELYEHHRFTVDRGQAYDRIDKYLAYKIGYISRSKIQAAAEAGSILVNGKAVKSNYKIKPLDEISVVLTYPPNETEIIPEEIPIDIVYEDEELLIVNKKPGMVVHPAHGNYNGTLVNALMWHLRDNPLFQSGETRPGLVHRIDKDTSGIMVIAKTEFSKSKLALDFFNRDIDRKYIALVWGDFKEDEGTIVGNIDRSVKDRKVRQVFPDGSQGKHAVTHYKVLERFRYLTLIECKLETGRTHQIRVHMQYIGHPLFNDETYGGNRILKGTTFSKYKQFVENCFNLLPRQALHAKSLGFTHPKTNQPMFFDSDLPDDMRMAMEKWRKYIHSGHELEEE